MTFASEWLASSGLRGVKSNPNGKKWTAQCPAHDDGHNSLSIAEGTEGQVLLHCHAGCSFGAILDALGVEAKELRPSDAVVPKNKKTKRKIAATYDYCDEGGRLLSQAIRYAPKSFTQRRPDGRGGWIWSMEGVRRVPYRLPELLSSAKEDWVWVPEGEKDVENLWNLHLPATCNAMGAGKWTDEHAKALAGRRVVILPDKDAAGRNHAMLVATTLQGVAAEVRVLELPGLAPRGDVSDWLAGGGTAEELLAMADAAPPAESYATAQPEEPEVSRNGSSPPVPSAMLDEDDLLPFLRGAGQNDLGNAQCIHRLHADELIFCRAFGWMCYTGTHWSEERGEAEARKLAVDTLLRRTRTVSGEGDLGLLSAAKPSARRVRDALYLYEPLVTVSSSEFDRVPYLLNVANGVVDLRTGALAAHEPGNRFSYCVPTPYVPGAESDLWYGRLMQWLNEDIHRIRYLQRCAGYWTTGEVREECLFYIYGPGRSGKGTCVNTIVQILGEPLAIGVKFDVFTNGHNDPQNFKLACLWNARLVAASENNRYERFDEGTVKMVTGRDPITAAFKRRDQFTYMPHFKVVLSNNHPISGDPDDDAFWRRFRLIEFPNGNIGKEDTTLKDALLTPEHRMAVLAWTIQGAIAWYKEGLGVPPSLDDALLEQRRKSDFVYLWLTDRTQAASRPDAWIEVDELYQSYVAWCDDNGTKPWSKPWFSKKLGEKGYRSEQKKIEGKNERRILGLELL